MKVLKRALISISRRKLNSFVLLLIVFVLSNVLLTTLTVTTSLKNTKEIVLKQFAPNVTVDYNFDNYKSNKTPKLTAEMGDKLYSQTKDILKSYDYSLQSYLDKTADVKASVIPGSEKTSDMGQEFISITGTQLSATSLVNKGEAKLIKGKGFSETDINEGNPKAIVSKQFAEINGLDIGSVLPLQRNLYTFDKASMTTGDAYFSSDIDLEVVGIIELNDVEEFIKKETANPTEDINKIYEMQRLADNVYVTNNFINPILVDNKERAKEKYPDEYEGIPGTPQNLNISPEFILKDMKDLDTFLEAAKKVYSEKHYTLTSAASEYETVAKPLSSMGELLDLVFKITVVASIVVLTLVLYIFMYLRQKEMGIFLALGERRWKIVGQLMMETLFVALIGATLAIFTSIVFSNMLTDNTISTLLTTVQKPINIYPDPSYGLTPDAISQQVQGGFGVVTLVIFYLTTALTIIISQLATVLYLIRLNPKKILM